MKRITAFLSFTLLISTPSLSQDLITKVVQNVDASGEEFVYYSLSQGRLSTTQEANFGGWDVAFQRTNIKVNGASQILGVGFDNLEEAPEEGYLLDDDGFSQIPSDAESRWFHYDATTHVVSALSDRTIVIRTRSGQYAKLKITNYYKTVFGSDPVPRSYTFRYVLQTDDSRNLN